MARFSNLDQPQNVTPFLLAAALLSAGFLTSLQLESISAGWFWAVALAARVVMLWASPGSDIYRYLWEGMIQTHGFSPYCLPPSAAALMPLRTDLWQQIRFPDVTAIYPPLAELGFRILAGLSAGVMLFKIAFFAADVLICVWLARRFGLPGAAVYAWNPLVIYSFAGGGHYDSWFALALVAAWLLWATPAASFRLRMASVTLLGAGIALKWVCFPMLGWTLWRIVRSDGWRKAGMASMLALLPLAVSWILVSQGNWNCSLYPASFSADARSAELLPAVIGPFLSLEHAEKHNEIYLVLFLAVSLFVIYTGRTYAGTLQAILLASLVTTPMFHAWYSTWLIPLAVTSRRRTVIAFSLSSFTYFWLHHTAGVPGGVWKQSALEKALLWAPLLISLVWDLRNLESKRREA